MKEKENCMPIEIAERVTAKNVRPPMSVEGFMVLYRDKDFRIALHELVNAHSRKPELREDMLQEAWLVISQLPAGMALEFYLQAGERAANKCRMKEGRRDELFQEDYEIKKIQDRDRKRTERAKKKAKYILRKRPK